MAFAVTAFFIINNSVYCIMHRFTFFIVLCLFIAMLIKTIGDEKALGQASEYSVSPLSAINPKLEPDTFFIKPMPKESYIDSVPKGLEYSEYISEVAIYAIDAYKATSMLPSVNIALSIHESGGGESELYKEYNSAHGIKCGSSALGTNLCSKSGKWKAYEDVADSFLDFGKFWHKHVPVIYDVCGNDWQKWSRLIPKNGYASGRHNKQYESALINIISKYKLYEIDKSVIHDRKVQSRKL
jgi:flagellum-specific peptidoglycan hydrolase FlgJ